MATALQKQLAAIAATSSNELDLKAQKAAHGKSLLFDQFTAASQSFDLLWQICSEGFQDLCALDSRFARFSKSIFSPHSRTEDRSLMTARENKELDTVLESFLVLVGSRLLIRPALKAVEWLVRRFRIHELNTSLTILTFLPYHNHDIFPALLSILPTQLPSAFKFLHTYVHSLSAPPLSILAYTASHNPGFFSSLNHYVLSAAKSRCGHTTLLTLWASICAQTVNEKLNSSKSGRQTIQQNREDSFLTEFLPILSDALSLRKQSELSLACYMITVILVTKADLSEVVVDAFLEAVISSWSNETFVAGLACAAAIFERKPTVQMPKRAAKDALKFPDLSTRLAALAAHQNVRPFAEGLLQQMAERPELMALVDFPAFVKPLLLHGVCDESMKHAIEQAISRSGVTSDTSMVDADTDTVRPRALITEDESRDNDDDVDSEEEMLTLDTLPTRLETTSFLALEATAAFSEFCTVFTRLSSKSDHGFGDFYSLPVWQRGGQHDPCLLTSFLIRVWTSASQSHARSEALAQFAASLDSLPQYELQHVLPYLLVGLSDPELTVRRQAVALALRLMDHQQDQQKLGSVETLNVYGNDCEVSLISLRAFANFLQKCLRHELEECQSDDSHIQEVFVTLMGRKPDSQDPSEGSSKALKSVQKQELFTFLSQHLRLAPSPVAKVRLSALCGGVIKAAGRPPTSALSEALQGWIVSEDAYAEVCQSESVSLPTVDNAMMRLVSVTDEPSMNLLLSLVKDSKLSVRQSLRKAAFARLQSLWPDCTQKRRGDLAKDLMEITFNSSQSANADLQKTEASALLRTVQFTPDVLVTLLNYACESMESTLPRSAKKRRTGSGKSATNQDSTAEDALAGMAKLGLVLDLVDSTNVAGQLRVFHALFHVLGILQDFRQRTTYDVDFVLLLTLSNLLSITTSFGASASPPQLDTAFVRTELIVEAIRRTDNAQVRNNGILLLSGLTKYLPEAVLQSVVPVFTLVSATSARQTDELSVHVVDQVIREIIPLLVEPIRRGTIDFIGAMSELLSSFAAAFLHIPLARRLKMFTLLASSLGPKESLCPIITTLVDQHRANGSVAVFCAQLMQQFPAIEGLQCISDYLNLVLSCVADTTSPFTPLMKKLDNQEDRENTARGLLIAAPVLVREGLPSAKIRIEMEAVDKADAIREKFGDLLIIENNLTFAETVKRVPQLRNSASKTLEDTLKLLPFSDFIKSIEPLLDPASENVSRSVLKSFEGQLRADTQFDRAARAAAIQFLPRLTALLNSSTDSPLKLNAVVCVDLVCEKFGKLDSNATLAAAQVVSGTSCAGSSNNFLRALSLHCLASTVEVLSDEFIPLLAPAFGLITESLEKSMQGQTPDMRLHSAALALAISLIDQLAYLASATNLVQLFTLIGASAVSATTSQAKTIRGQFMQAVASNVDVFVAVEAMQSAWPLITAKGPKAFAEASNLLSAVFMAAPKSKVAKRPHVLLEAFMTFLDLRSVVVSSQLTGIYPEEQLDGLELSVIETLMALVLKVNDAAFHPFFRSLVSWADKAAKDVSAVSVLRWTVIFNLLTSLSDRLKSLVTHYFNDVLDRMIKILLDSTDAFAVSARSATPEQQYKLRRATSALTALTSSLRHDANDFYATPARFDQLHPALLTLLPACNPSPPDSVTRMHTIPAIVGLATCLSGNSPHLVALQTSILERLLKYNVKRTAPAKEVTRGRLAGVMAMRAIGHELGEEWLAELPRMLPVVSELMEDDDERVEQETSAWVQEMEGVLGENVGDMLT